MLKALVVACLFSLHASTALRLLLPTYGIEGPVKNGGISTFTLALAELLKV